MNDRAANDRGFRRPLEATLGPLKARNAAASVLALSIAICATAGAGDPAQARDPRDSSASPSTWSDVEFGRRLFFDRRLSADASISCASCHDPAHAFADPRPVSTGVRGGQGQRHAPSLLDVGDRPALFWDGRSATLEDQALGPLRNPREQGLSIEALVRIVRGDADYREALRRREHEDEEEASAATVHLITSALSAYERTLHSPDSPVDRLVKGEVADIPIAVRRGFEAFRGAGQCATCHRVEGPRPALTDDAFHAASSNLAESVLRELPGNARRLADARSRWRDVGELITNDGSVSALGRFAVTMNPADVGLFRTPSLRVVASSGPYMHDGSVADLREVVRQEAYRRVDGLRRPIPLTADQLDDLVAFLGSLAMAQTP